MKIVVAASHIRRIAPGGAMKIILSRKGFDSGAGGTSSPILEDGSIVSLPIPDGKSRTKYRDVNRHGANLGKLASDLTRGKIRDRYPCHLDPDLDHGSIARLPGWRAAFGQTSAAQTHLAGEGVGPGDLFLFFGWFREAELRVGEKDGNYAWKPRTPHRHVIFGWLQIGEILPVHGREKDILKTYPWLKDHPHLNRPHDKMNHIYVATEQLTLPGAAPVRTAGGEVIPGAGSFNRLKDDLILTSSTTRNRSLWSLPGFYHPDTEDTRLSYHDKAERWSMAGERTLLQSASRGQEFVFRYPQAKYPNIRNWLTALFTT